MGIAIWRSVWVDYGPDAGTEPAQKFGPEICHLMKSHLQIKFAYVSNFKDFKSFIGEHTY